MAKRSIDDHETPAADAADVVTVVEGGPIEFELGGKTWHLRQPTPLEVTRIGFWYDIARHRAWQDLEASDLRRVDIESMVQDAMRTGYLTAKHEAEQDQEKRRDLAEQIVDLKRADKSSAWDDMARAYALAERDRQALALLLADDDKDALLSSSGAVQAARQHVWRVLSLAGTVPNWNGRTA